MRAVLFDLNGTLLDDLKLIIEASSEVLVSFKKKPLTWDDYFKALQQKDYMNIYRSRGIRASRKKCIEIYLNHYRKHAHTICLSKNVVKTLASLKRRRVKLGVITTQQEEFVKPILEKLGIVKYFVVIESHVLDKTGLIKKLIKESNMDPGNCYYVGDTPSDIKQAQRAGVKSVAFLNGLVPIGLMVKEKPDHLIRDMIELVDIV